MGRPASRSGAEARDLEGAGEVSGAMARPEVKIGLPSHASDACGVCFLLLHTSHARHHDITPVSSAHYTVQVINTRLARRMVNNPACR